MDHLSQAERRETLQYLLSSDVPAHYKRVLVDALTQAIREEEAAVELDVAHAVSKPWSSAETEIVRAHLSNRTAKSWQHADEALTHLAVSLRRGRDDIRSKAIQLGLGTSVDYRLAREQSRAKEHED